MSSSKLQEQPHDTPQAQAWGLAPNSTKLELNNPKARPRSLIDKLANITGDLWSDGDIQIDGHLCGNVNCEQLILGKDAAVIGAIIAHEVVIRGKMTGLIRATRVLLQATARVESEIIYQSLSVDEGASFAGIALPRANPFAEELPAVPMVELRQRVIPAEVSLPQAADCGASSQPTGNLEATPEPLRSIEHSVAAGSRRPALTDMSANQRSLSMPQVCETCSTWSSD
jgi:cytoskeletal protein CcmA (bactofilin family)